MKSAPLWLTVTLGVLLGLASIAYGFRLHDLSSQLHSVQDQLAAVNAKAAGAHRDLITCADLQALGLQTLVDINLNTDATGTISASPDEVPVVLPSHCINQ